MAVTWEELQIRCLQKVFSIDGDVLVVDSNTQPYIKSMPGAANEAMQILVTAGRAFKKCMTISQTGAAEEEPEKETEEDTTVPAEETDTGGMDTEGEEVPSYRENLGSWIAYDLKGLTGDFYILGEIRLDDGERYEAFTGYRMEGDALLLLPASQKGTFRIWYEAYPPKITKDTPPDFIIDLHPEELSMIALYMAGQLYKDDDISIAQIYMNEWLTWLEELKVSAERAKAKNKKSGSWSSVKGWY